jgi:hypothetical protein
MKVIVSIMVENDQDLEVVLNQENIHHQVKTMKLINIIKNLKILLIVVVVVMIDHIVIKTEVVDTDLEVDRQYIKELNQNHRDMIVKTIHQAPIPGMNFI